MVLQLIPQKHLFISCLIIFALLFSLMGCNQADLAEDEQVIINEASEEEPEKQIIEDSVSETDSPEVKKEKEIVTISWQDGLYTGKLKDGLPHGMGVWEKSNGERYEGYWKKGYKNHTGNYSWPNGGEITGTWLDGILVSGEIVRESAGIENYAGGVADGKPHGFGIRNLSEGTSNTERSYLGDWVNGIRHGWGIEVIGHWERYEGEWGNDLQNGFGKRVFFQGANKQYAEYEGEWRNGYPHGPGSFSFIERYAIKGKWIFGKLIEDQSEIDLATIESHLDEKVKLEIQKLRSNEFYYQPHFNDLGLVIEAIIVKYGIPSKIYNSPFGPTEVVDLIYDDLGYRFTVNTEAWVVDELSCYKDAELLGIKVGMTFEQIESRLGKADFEGFCPVGSGQTLYYIFGEYPDGMSKGEAFRDRLYEVAAYFHEPLDNCKLTESRATISTGLLWNTFFNVRMN
jgi:hypothetical protein